MSFKARESLGHVSVGAFREVCFLMTRREAHEESYPSGGCHTRTGYLEMLLSS